MITTDRQELYTEVMSLTNEEEVNDAVIYLDAKLKTYGDGYYSPKESDISYDKRSVKVEVDGVTYSAEQFSSLFTVIKVGKDNKVYKVDLDSFIVNSYGDFEFNTEDEYYDACDRYE